MKILSILTVTIFFAFVLACQPTTTKEVADLVLLDGAVYTVNSELPWGEAIAVKQGRILEVGSSQDIRQFIGEGTQVIELKGALVVPGFFDSHTHFLNGGFALSSIQLRDTKSKQEFIARIAEKVSEIDKGKWILNGDWDQQWFDPVELPTTEWIDEVTPENPVYVNRLDGHMVFVNSLALRMAGITKNTPSPDGGVIVKDPQTGEPTGILKDKAMDLVLQHIPEPTFKEKIRAAESALSYAAQNGVTSIHDMAYSADFEVYQELLKAGKMTARLYVYIPISEVDIYSRLRLKTPFGNNFLKIGGLKGFVDGSLGSSTALFFEPYLDNPEKSGILVSDMYPPGIMGQRIMQADKAGLQVAIHAIGDRANHVILDIFEKAISENGKRDRRWRIEHAQHLIPEDIDRIAELGILASVQPYHCIDDGRWAEKKIGKKRAEFTYAFRSLLDEGAKLVCGSDWPVAPMNPIFGIYAAVTRRTQDGKNLEGWVPEQKISLEEAIKGFTLDAAYAEFAEDVKGSLEKGKLADLVVLDRNLFEIPPEDIENAKVQMTVCNGKIVYKK